MAKRALIFHTVINHQELRKCLFTRPLFTLVRATLSRVAPFIVYSVTNYRTHLSHFWVEKYVYDIVPLEFIFAEGFLAKIALKCL